MTLEILIYVYVFGLLITGSWGLWWIAAVLAYNGIKGWWVPEAL